MFNKSDIHHPVDEENNENERHDEGDEENAVAKEAKPLDKSRYLRCSLIAFHLSVASYKAPACVVSLVYVVLHLFLPVESEHNKCTMQPS